MTARTESTTLVPTKFGKSPQGSFAMTSDLVELDVLLLLLLCSYSLCSLLSIAEAL